MSRNAFRDTAEAWAYDTIAQNAVKSATASENVMREILGLHPFMHAEDLEMQRFGRDMLADHIEQYKHHPDTEGLVQS